MKIADLSTLKNLSSNEADNVGGGQLPGVPAHLANYGVVTQAPTNTTIAEDSKKEYYQSPSFKANINNGIFYFRRPRGRFPRF